MGRWRGSRRGERLSRTRHRSSKEVNEGKDMGAWACGRAGVADGPDCRLVPTVTEERRKYEREKELHETKECGQAEVHKGREG